MKNWLRMFKEKPLTQVVFDVAYEEACPVCHIKVKGGEHRYKEPSGERILIECPGCHVALYGKQVKYTKILQTYVRDGSGPLGLKMIKEEIIDEGED